MPSAGLEIPRDMPLSVRQASGGLPKSACFAMSRAHVAATNMEESFSSCCVPSNKQRVSKRVWGLLSASPVEYMVESARGAEGDPLLGCMHCWQRQSATIWLCSSAGQLPSAHS